MESILGSYLAFQPGNLATFSNLGRNSNLATWQPVKHARLPGCRFEPNQPAWLPRPVTVSWAVILRSRVGGKVRIAGLENLAGLSPQEGYREIRVVVYSQDALSRVGAGRGSHPPRRPTWIFFLPGCRVAGMPGRDSTGQHLFAQSSD